jgi:radical SAM protein with 4Fe4S-binding SPASM domain
VATRRLPLLEAAQRERPLEDEVRPIDRKWRPSYVVWELTLACDLACHHCGSRAARARPDELTTEECLDLADQIAALGANEVTIIGGEAYLRDDWTEIIRRIRKHGMRCGMATGGRGLTQERVLAAKDAGLEAISVSIDGLEEEHDALRGVRGSFRAAMDAMDRIRAIGGIRLSANTQINKKNLHVIDRVFDLIAEKGATAWQVQLTAAMGRAADPGGDGSFVFLDPYEVLYVHPLLARLKRAGERRGVVMWPGNNVGHFGPFEGVIRGHFKATYRGSCGAGRLSLGIESNGDIKGCPSLPTNPYVGGNVREQKLVDIWERAAPLRFTRDMTAADLRGFCKDCYYAQECRGGCHWTSHVLLGYPGDNPYCHHRALELMAQGVRERVRLVEEAPNLPYDNARYVVEREPFPPDERAAVERLNTETEALVWPAVDPLARSA